MYIISVLGHITISANRKPLSVEDLSFYGTLIHKVSINEKSTHTCTLYQSVSQKLTLLSAEPKFSDM